MRSLRAFWLLVSVIAATGRSKERAEPSPESRIHQLEQQLEQE
jgi:hypothetical protein